MSFNAAYQSLIDFDLKNDRKKKSEKKETLKKDTVKPAETRKRSRSRSPNPKVESKKEAAVNYDIPSRQFGDLYCVVCDSHMNSEQMWENHIKGKRHLKSSKKGDAVENKYEYCDEEPVIQKELDKETRPIAGLDHICEILRVNQPPIYQCFLCSASLTTSKLLMEHIMGLKHQMAFLKEHDKEKYALVDSSALSKSYLEPIVQDLISKYENEHGRGKMSVKKEKEKSGSFSYEKRCDEDEDNKPAALKSSKYSSLPKTSRHSPQPKTSRYSPPPKTSRYSPPPKTSRYSPPPKTSRYSPPPKTSRYSPPPKTSRYSPSSKTSRYSPPPKTSRYSPSPKSSRYSPPPKSVRMKARNSESEWKKVSPVREGFRETMCSDRSLYSEEEMWAKIEPEPSYYRREPAYLDIDSRLDQTNNYNRAWTPPNTGNCSDLRVVLEHKKNLGMTSTTARANTNVLAAVSASSEINNVSDSLLHLIDDMSPEVFLSLALFKLDNMLVQEETELKLLDRVANKATALALDVKKKFLPPDLKAKYKEALAQNGISPQSNSMKGVSSQSNLEFTQNLNNLIGHYKDRKTTAYEDVHSQDSYSNRLLQSEQFIDNRSSAHHQLTTSPQCRNSQERASSFESEWNQRSSTSLPFQSFSSTPTTIPGLTLTEEPPAQPSTSTVLSQFAQTAKNIFGNINVPTTPSNPYQNEDYNRLNYRY